MGDKVKKVLTAEEAQEKLSLAKEKLVAAKDELKSFCKKNGVKSNEDHSNHEDEKIAKGYKKRKAEVDEANGRVEKYTEAKKSAKKAGATKKAKYNYPAEVKTGDAKKKFRTETRAKAKRAGVSVDVYLADPAKYDKMLKEKKEEKSSKKEKKAKKKEKKAEVAEEPKKKKKKKAAAEPSKEEASGAAESED